MKINNKHYRGIILLIVLIIFYYLYSLIVFSFVKESSLLFESIFIIVYLILLFFTSLYLYRNNLNKQLIILNVFCLVIANSFIPPLLYLPIALLFENSFLLEIVDVVVHILTYPFDIAISDWVYIIMGISPLIPLIFLLRKKKHKSRTEDDSVH